MRKVRGAIVVGGAGGIGSDICRRFAADGYRVTVADLNLQGANDALRSLAGEGHDVVQLDVTNDAQVDAAFDAVEARFPASVLVVASGGLLIDPRTRPTIATLSTSDWNKTIAYNLTGVFFCLRKFAQLRLAHPLEHSRIITLSSGAGQLAGTPTDLGYVASKTAIIGLTRQVAFDLAPANITVNTVAPGPVGTPEFFRNTTEQVRAATAGVTVLKRLAVPEEVSAGVAFLASPEASYITGTTLDINAGAHMH
jgi:NAD(P)-dependent dehydrogenase (short-subunit alcohol dehydrogenase family)